MINKTIYYCWFGKKDLPKSVKFCIKSWKEKCPDFKIIQINENNFKISEKCKFVQEAYMKEKWAFVSDYARVETIFLYGGIYLDTDVELICSLDKLIRDCRGYFGFEKKDIINSGLGFACEKGEPILKEIMMYYEKLKYDESNLTNNASPAIITKILAENGIRLDNSYQIINGIKILPMDYLCPENMYTGKKKYTQNTVSVHHYSASWMSNKDRKKMKIIIMIKKILPSEFINFLRKVIGRLENMNN